VPGFGDHGQHAVRMSPRRILGPPPNRLRPSTVAPRPIPTGPLILSGLHNRFLLETLLMHSIYRTIGCNRIPNHPSFSEPIKWAVTETASRRGLVVARFPGGVALGGAKRGGAVLVVVPSA